MTRRRGRRERRGRRGGAALRLVTLFAGMLVVGQVVAVVGCAERLFYYPSRSVFETPEGVEDVWFAAPDGTRLHGWFLPAVGVPEGERAPTVVHCHGNAGHVGRHLEFVRFLPAAGVNVFIFDYRGYGRSAPARLRRDALVTDALAAVDHVMTRADVDADRVGIFGLSLGGTIGLAAAAEDQRVRAVASVATFSRWRSVAGDHSGLIGRWLIADGFDAVDSAARLGDRPLLLMHGTADGIVASYHAGLIADAAAAAGVPVAVEFLDGAGHIDWVDRRAAREALTRFFVDALGSVDEATATGAAER